MTSSVVTSRPLTGATFWNFAPCLSFTVQVMPSGLSADSARSGMGDCSYGFLSGCASMR